MIRKIVDYIICIFIEVQFHAFSVFRCLIIVSEPLLMKTLPGQMSLQKDRIHLKYRATKANTQVYI